MTPRSSWQPALALSLLSASVVGQELPQQNPVAATALSGVVLQQDFGDFKFQKREIATSANNTRVPGLGGLAFVYYKNADGERIMLSIQWFDDSKEVAPVP